MGKIRPPSFCESSGRFRNRMAVSYTVTVVRDEFEIIPTGGLV